MAEVRSKPTFRTLNEQPDAYKWSSLLTFAAYAAAIVGILLAMAGYLRDSEGHRLDQSAIVELRRTNLDLQEKNRSLQQTVDQLSERIASQERITDGLEGRVRVLERKNKSSNPVPNKNGTRK